MSSRFWVTNFLLSDNRNVENPTDKIMQKHRSGIHSTSVAMQLERCRAGQPRVEITWSLPLTNKDWKQKTKVIKNNHTATVRIDLQPGIKLSRRELELPTYRFRARCRYCATQDMSATSIKYLVVVPSRVAGSAVVRFI